VPATTNRIQQTEEFLREEIARLADELIRIGWGGVSPARVEEYRRVARRKWELEQELMRIRAMRAMKGVAQ